MGPEGRHICRSLRDHRAWRLGIRWSPFWLVTVTTLIIHVGFFTFTATDRWMALVKWFADLPF